MTLEMGGAHDDLVTAEHHRDFLKKRIAGSKDPARRAMLEKELVKAEQAIAKLTAEAEAE